jgi:flagellar hook-associated protein 3 FlgL
MLSGLDPHTQRFLMDLGYMTRRLQQSQVRIASGLKMQSPSDAPEDVTRLLYLRSLHDFTAQLRVNLGRVQTEVNAAEQSLQSAVAIVERAAVLGTQGATDLMSAAQRSSIAGEIEALMRQLIDVASTQVEGRYIFSGDADGAAPYILDLSQDDPFSPYQGSASSRETMHPVGTRFGIALTAAEIFDHPDPEKNVFQALNSLRLALKDNDTDAIMQALGRLRSSEVHLNNQLAFYGTLQNQVAAGLEFAHKQEMRLRSEIGTIEDADLAKEILEMNQTRLVQEAALQTQARMRRVSLFDYLG